MACFSCCHWFVNSLSFFLLPLTTVTPPLETSRVFSSIGFIMNPHQIDIQHMSTGHQFNLVTIRRM